MRFSKQVKYFVAKNVSRSNVSLETWNKFYHDHTVEIATGRVQVLTGRLRRPRKLPKPPLKPTASFSPLVARRWEGPNGTVGHPQSVGHKELTAKGILGQVTTANRAGGAGSVRDLGPAFSFPYFLLVRS